MDVGWYFKMTSALYGTEDFGPYDTRGDARKGLERVQDRARAEGDGIERWYTGPYRLADEKDEHGPVPDLMRPPEKAESTG